MYDKYSGGAGKRSLSGHLYNCKLLVSRSFHVKKKREQRLVSQTLLARIVAT